MKNIIIRYFKRRCALMVEKYFRLGKKMRVDSYPFYVNQSGGISQKIGIGVVRVHTIAGDAMMDRVIIYLRTNRYIVMIHVDIDIIMHFIIVKSHIILIGETGAGLMTRYVIVS